MPNIEGLGLGEAEVDYDRERGIIVNERLETSALGISAIGDVNGVCTLASSARAQARVAVENILGCRMRFSPGETPRCILTDPAVAAAGISEDQAHSVHRPIRAASAIFRGATPGAEPAGLIKLIADPLTGRLLGGMIVAESAHEWIGELSVALKFDAQTQAFAEVPRANDGFEAAIRACAHEMFP
jgi:pyruvate/2-oxoglutarate dehydrogenase complex dihydrolipoamide dehydrogenase (E3) component